MLSLSSPLTPVILAEALVKACADHDAQLVAVDRTNSPRDPIYGDPVSLKLGERLLISLWMTQRFILIDAYEWLPEQHRADSLHQATTIDLLVESESLVALVARIKGDFIARALTQIAQRASRRKHAENVAAVADRLASRFGASNTHREDDLSEATVTLWNRTDRLFDPVACATVKWSPLNNDDGVSVDLSLSELRESEAIRLLDLLAQLRAERCDDEHVLTGRMRL